MIRTTLPTEAKLVVSSKLYISSSVSRKLQHFNQNTDQLYSRLLINYWLHTIEFTGIVFGTGIKVDT